VAGEEPEKTIHAAPGRGVGTPPSSGPERRMLLWAAVAAVVVVLAAVYYAFLLPPPFHIRTGDRAEILAADPQHLLIFRYRNDPHIVVLDFPSLHQQGQMLNRVAAFVEKAGIPHDRVLTDAELSDAIKASGSSPDDYYYGHDYRAADLVRFFHLLALDHVAPNPEERRLRALLGFLHWFAPGADGAIITLPGPGKAAGLDASGRATILEHELSHGAYFTIPAYDVYVHRFYHDVLDAKDRAAFRQFLAGEGYDTGINDLIVNETLAYLMFTPDPRFFSPAVAGLPPARIEKLRAAFRPGIPVEWLKRFLPADAPVSPGGAEAAAKPRRRRRLPQCLGVSCVSRRKAVASRRSPAPCAALSAASSAGR